MFDIYRVEHGACGWGPYHLYGMELIAPDAKHYRPTPQEDNIDDFNQSWYCGFSSLSQYQDWFGCQSQYLLKEAGYILSLYQARDEWVKAGDKQVAFLRPLARYINAFSPILVSGDLSSPHPRPEWVDINTPHTGVY